MLYFDLRNGGVFFNKSKFYVDLRSMYKNKFREEWEPSSDPSSYLFDRSRYDELVNKFMSRRMNEYY